MTASLIGTGAGGAGLVDPRRGAGVRAVPCARVFVRRRPRADALFVLAALPFAALAWARPSETTTSAFVVALLAVALVHRSCRGGTSRRDPALAEGLVAADRDALRVTAGDRGWRFARWRLASAVVIPRDDGRATVAVALRGGGEVSLELADLAQARGIQDALALRARARGVRVGLTVARPAERAAGAVALVALLVALVCAVAARWTRDPTAGLHAWGAAALIIALARLGSRRVWLTSDGVALRTALATRSIHRDEVRDATWEPGGRLAIELATGERLTLALDPWRASDPDDAVALPAAVAAHVALPAGARARAVRPTSGR